MTCGPSTPAISSSGASERMAACSRRSWTTETAAACTEWIGTLDKVLQLDFDSAIPGHGPVLSKDDVRAFRQKLVTLRQRAEELVKSGVRRTEFMAKLKTDDLNWPFPKERIDPLYDELAAKR